MFTKKKLDIRDEENDPRNIHVNMYNYTKKFKKLLTGTLAVTIAALMILMIGLFGTYSGFEDRINESGTYIELYGSDCEGRGYEPPPEQICLLFIPSDDGAPLGITVGELINHHYIIAGWFVIGTIILFITLICTAVYSRQMKGPLAETLHQYIQESYFLNIQLTSPKGTTRAERIANLLWSVFPEVYSVSDNESEENVKIPYTVDRKEGGYTFDFYLKADDVKFAAIFLKGKLTLEKLKEFTKQVDSSFNGDGDHVICIAKEFDPIFDSDELEEKIDEIHQGVFNLDILKEDDNNQFSIVWVD